MPAPFISNVNKNENQPKTQETKHNPNLQLSSFFTQSSKKADAIREQEIDDHFKGVGPIEPGPF